MTARRRDGSIWHSVSFRGATGFKSLWRDTSSTLFGEVTYGTLKYTRRLANLIFEAQTQPAPTRIGFRTKLDQIEGLAGRLSCLLADPQIQELAPEIPDALAGRDGDAATRLGWVARLAARKQEQIPVGAGRGSASAALGRPGPQIQCAACVAEVWARRGKKLTNGSDDARIACAALWKLSGGQLAKKAEDGGTDSEAMWDRHLRAVMPRKESTPTRRRRGDPVTSGDEGTRGVKVEVASARASKALGGWRVQN